MNTFTLKCVGCENVETREAEACEAQPFCVKCGCPMIVDKAEIKPRKQEPMFDRRKPWGTRPRQA